MLVFVCFKVVYGVFVVTNIVLTFDYDNRNSCRMVLFLYLEFSYRYILPNIFLIEGVAYYFRLRRLFPLMALIFNRRLLVII